MRYNCFHAEMLDVASERNLTRNPSAPCRSKHEKVHSNTPPQIHSRIPFEFGILLSALPIRAHRSQDLGTRKSLSVAVFGTDHMAL